MPVPVPYPDPTIHALDLLYKSDAATVSAWPNAGRQGATFDLGQSTGAAQPAIGKLGKLAAPVFNGGDAITTAVGNGGGGGAIETLITATTTPFALFGVAQAAPIASMGTGARRYINLGTAAASLYGYIIAYGQGLGHSGWFGTGATAVPDTANRPLNAQPFIWWLGCDGAGVGAFYWNGVLQADVTFGLTAAPTGSIVAGSTINSGGTQDWLGPVGTWGLHVGSNLSGSRAEILARISAIHGVRLASDAADVVCTLNDGRDVATSLAGGESVPFSVRSNVDPTLIRPQFAMSQGGADAVASADWRAGTWGGTYAADQTVAVPPVAPGGFPSVTTAGDWNLYCAVYAGHETVVFRRKVHLSA